jgi:lipopolysaccharide transport system permease protein
MVSLTKGSLGRLDCLPLTQRLIIDTSDALTSRQNSGGKGSTLNPANRATQPLQTSSLTNKPLVVIQPSRLWVALNLKELWAYRELLYFLTWRDVKVRYKQTFLGIAWAILQPLLTMIVFTIFFGRLAGIDAKTDGIPYPIFVFAGLMPWTFFSNAISTSGNSLVNNANLITKVYFPRLIIPTAAVMAGLVDLGIASFLLVGMMFYYSVALSWWLLLFPVLVVLTTLLAVATGMWLSALNVKYRDIRHALPFVVQIWMFVSPIIYPSSSIPEKWRWVLSLNPMTGIIEGYRSSLFGRPVNWTQLGTSVIIILALLIYGAYSFRKMEKDFADIV